MLAAECWLELDDKALLDSYTVLQEGILCDAFWQKCSAAWQGAPGQRLTVAIMLPGRQDGDDWLNFMLSQKNLCRCFVTNIPVFCNNISMTVWKSNSLACACKTHVMTE